ncbi:MAG: SH3 domain-containing protein [Pleurocapsa minor GSE-CHR-MK-17-07R]|nr:SH3 domain-containing protein [Pleurocapsa minor GSE-CHR-MK 17-07R]
MSNPPIPPPPPLDPQSSRRAAAAEAARSRVRSRGESALYLPLWSVLLMLGIVFVAAFGLMALVYSLGGSATSSSSPRIVIYTAIPSDTPLPGETGEAPPVVIATVNPNATSSGPAPVFALEGPTLQPVILSPTPITINIGSTVSVNADSLNVRAGAGTDQELLFTASLGTLLRVVDGPRSATGLTWWQVQNPADPSQIGWAASEFLDAQPG